MNIDPEFASASNFPTALYASISGISTAVLARVLFRFYEKLICCVVHKEGCSVAVQGSKA